MNVRGKPQLVTSLLAFCLGSTGCVDSKESKSKSVLSSKVELFGKTFYVEHHSDFANSQNLINGCPLWDAYWVTSKVSCKFAQYQEATKETDGYRAYRSDDGQFEVNGLITARDNVGTTKIKLDTTEYFCKTSGTRLLDQNGAVLVEYPQIFILTSQDAGTFAELLPSSVYSIAFRDAEACSLIYTK